MSHLVTRYDEYTNDLDVIALTSSIHKAHELISQDVSRNGLSKVRKITGDKPYSLNFQTDYVTVSVKEQGIMLRYNITTIPMDELVLVSSF